MEGSLKVVFVSGGARLEIVERVASDLELVRASVGNIEQLFEDARYGAYIYAGRHKRELWALAQKYGYQPIELEQIIETGVAPHGRRS